MSSPKSKKTESLIEKAIKVSERVQIKDVALLGSSSRWRGFGSKIGNNFATTFNAQGDLSSDKTKLFAIINFAIEMQNEDNKPIADITADFLVAYSINNTRGLKKEHYDAFATYNGIYNAWPYWREFVQSITSKMQMPTLTIPVYRFGNDELPKTEGFIESKKQAKKIKKKVKSKPN